ncbi:major facilitator superfamily domain-containing protein [Dactylonectria estremocensis]|uniref:Major facilitator superfamily domain-containing protein n=1 Tax=Dactylonectria estremocensis TaxID=1079267 RepID=A0A9P9IV12_9HYPO|nr:major facilitator superfamily domain-containing protein [Dactylonectria estremocensis]
MAVMQQDDGSPAYKETLGAMSPSTVVVSDGPLKENLEENETDSPSTEQKKAPPAFNRDWRFWMIMLTLVISTLLSSLESTVVITSLPTIVGDLKIGSDYIWITNVYFLTSACLQPLFGQLCNLFGRRHVMVFIFGTYTLGSGICGGSNSAAMLIAGRAIQGIGAGGVAVAGDVIVSDLVPLRYRGNYIAILLVVATVGFAVGPFIGGVIVEKTTWRWIFYLNLPLGGVGMVIAYMFLNLQWDREESTMAKLRRIDYGGNAILFAASVSILIALTWAGPVYPWSDARILVPLFLGVAGLAGFVVYEGSGIPVEPVMPVRLFPHRTARIIYFQTFLNSVLIMWCYYFLPLYFQGVMLSTPSRSGVQMLPVALIAIPGAAVSSLMLSRWGKYKLLHMTGFFLLSLGGGMLALLKEDSPDVAWILIQILPAIGSGFLLSTLLPAFQASTEEIDQAAATGTWSFVRTFGMVWGVAVAGTIFNTYTKRYAHQIDDPLAREHLSSGDAYASATRNFVLQFEQPAQDQIRHVFMLALRRVYAISAAFGGAAFILGIFEKDIPLRKELDTQYGLEEKKDNDKSKEEV